MRISDIIKNRAKTIFSIEIFPPKTADAIEALKTRLFTFARYRPDFISVTYGALGLARGGTTDLAHFVQAEIKTPAMAHLTCGMHSSEEIGAILNENHAQGIQNLMALRGDPPADPSRENSFPGPLAHASDLIRIAAERGGFCIGCAAYPEGHVEAPSLDQDIEHLKQKLDLGAAFMVSQFFLDNDFFFRFRDKLLKKGISSPLFAGILPISNYTQITRFSIMCGCTIPARVMKGLHGKSDTDQESFGLDHAARQIEGLLREGVQGIHLYALNKQRAVERLAPLLLRKL